MTAPTETADPERATLVEQADDICRAASDKEAQVGVLRDDADVLRAIGPQILAIRREKLERLRKLQVPPDERSGWTNLTALMDETYDALAVAIRDARAQREPDLTEVQRLGDALAATSVPYEFTWCP